MSHHHDYCEICYRKLCDCDNVEAHEDRRIEALLESMRDRKDDR